jgi:hypothetical protein
MELKDILLLSWGCGFFLALLFYRGAKLDLKRTEKAYEELKKVTQIEELQKLAHIMKNERFYEFNLDGRVMLMHLFRGMLNPSVTRILQAEALEILLKKAGALIDESEKLADWHHRYSAAIRHNPLMHSATQAQYFPYLKVVSERQQEFEDAMAAAIRWGALNTSMSPYEYQNWYMQGLGLSSMPPDDDQQAEAPTTEASESDASEASSKHEQRGCA